MATLAWFLAAARTSDGPPMSISSISSSRVMPGRSAAAANGYRLTTTSSNGAIAGLEQLRAGGRRAAGRPGSRRGSAGGAS